MVRDDFGQKKAPGVTRGLRYNLAATYSPTALQLQYHRR